MSKIVIVQKGDCFINICKHEGFFWEAVWNHPENQKLREQRKEHNILKEGDQIYIPELELKEYSCETEQKHTFMIKSSPVKFTLTLLNLGKPRTNEDYSLSIDGFDRRIGKTDATGTLTEMISPTARYGVLLLGEELDEFQINFGYLDPIEEISGIQTRLQNLGFYAGKIDDELDSKTVTAIAEFQRSVELSATGELDDETRQKLIEIHGS